MGKHDSKCPKCNGKLSPQVDTQDDNEPFWHCDRCDQSYTIDLEPSLYFTCVPDPAAGEESKR